MRTLLFTLLFTLLMLLALPLAAEEFLDPELAFRAEAHALDGRTVELRFDIAPGYYLYRDRFRFSVPPTEASLGSPEFPAGEKHDDEFFGPSIVYRGQAVVRVPIERAAGAGAQDLALDVVLQGCAVAGFCYPPQPRTLHVQLPAAGAAAGDESGRIAGALGRSGLLGNLLFFFAAGLGLSLTPCVFPMIPILSGIIVGQRGKISRARSVALSALYVLGMALTYAAAGVAAGSTGTLISASLQNPWVLGGFALVFVALSLSMFGLYELQLPSALQSRLAGRADRIKGGNGLGVFAMGALSALIVGPCVAAPLAGALLYIGRTHDVLLGGLALFVMALGMGVPLLAVGASAGALLPHSGAWMERVKRVFGVVLLATALYLVSPLLPPAALMVAIALLLIVPAVFLHALDPLPAQAGAVPRLGKAAGIVMLITGSSLLLGALAGNRDPARPLAGVAMAANDAAAQALPFEPVRSVDELAQALRTANRPVLLDVTAAWCAACREMERVTFADPVVRAKLASFRLLQADVSANDAGARALLARFGLYGPPGVLLFAQGNESAQQRLVGFQEPAVLMAAVKSLD